MPQALKDLLTRIIPEKRFDDLRELVKHGVIDPLAVPEKHPLMSPVSQVMATGDDSKNGWPRFSSKTPRRCKRP